MGYNLHKWTERVRSRTDISGFLYHLTKETDDMKALEVLNKILTERKIIGSNSLGYIAGKSRAACFQDVPIYSLCQNTYHEQKFREELGGKVRYKPVGLAFGKRYVYQKGGRPVIYERLDVARKFLAEEEMWRVVSYDLSDDENIVDWTHEREWRVKGDFIFEIEEAYVLLTSKKTYKTFINMVGSDILRDIGGIILLDPILT